MLYNELLEAVVNTLPILNAGRKGNKTGGMQVIFPNPSYGWIPGWRWRYLRLKKDTLEEIIEVGFRAPIT